MVNTKPTLLILAAGLGSRYGSLKQIDRIGPSGERIIDYSVYDAYKAGFKKVVYVIRKSFEDEFKEVILDELPECIERDYVFQEIDSFHIEKNSTKKREKPWGTGHALLCASLKITEPFVIINADDFYGAESFKMAYEFLINKNDNRTEHALIGFYLNNTLSEYGSVSRGICEVDQNRNMTSIIERTEIKKVNNKITYKDDSGDWHKLGGSEIASMNMFAFAPSVFNNLEQKFYEFLKNHSEDIKTEFYLPSFVDVLIKEGEKVKILNTPSEWFGLTFKEDKKIVSNKINELVSKGVYPTKLWK